MLILMNSGFVVDMAEESDVIACFDDRQYKSRPRVMLASSQYIQSHPLTINVLNFHICVSPQAI